MFSLSRFYNRFYGAVAAVVCMAAAVSCSDDLKVPGTTVEEGRETTVSLSFAVPQMNVQSRMTVEQESTVSSLWVGIYNVGSGLRTNELPTEGYYVITPSSTNQHPDGGNTPDYSLPTIKTRTGASYIVAVANVRQNLGITDNAALLEDLGIDKGDRTKSLAELLAAADTWEKFKSISHVLNQADNVQYMTPNLPMAGTYMEGNHAGRPAGRPADGPTPVTIVDGQKLTGKIHLRRLVAKNTFIIKGGTNVEFEPTGWQLINNPVISYVQEQEVNAADVSDYFEGTGGDFEGNYSNSPNSFQFDKADGGGYTFEFYQLENKHTALEWDAAGGGTGIPTDANALSGYKQVYQYRDREFKNPLGDNNVQNTGVFRSLVRSEGEPVIGTESMNNRASYVQITGNVSYYIDPVAEGANPGQEIPVPSDKEGAVQRTAYVTYTIHLGYCEGADDAAKAADFNCRRNTRYTYTVTVNGVNDIIVEAMKQGENQPGAEGDVLDSTNEVLELDAHYQAFNVRLSDEEVLSMTYEIHAPYGAETKSFVWEKGSTESPVKNENDRPFVDWVKMRPTTSQTAIASYKTTDGNGPWSLDDMRKGGHLSNSAADAEGRKWYTVFIDEYVYHFGADGKPKDDDGNEEGQDWTKFVDKPDRTFSLIAVRRGTSTDGESTYGQYRYSIRQKSIQTYYSKSGNVSATALGAEHVNESYGLNLRWSSAVPTPTGGWNPDNGRWNMWQYVGSNQNLRNRWSTHLDANTLMSVPAINNTNMVAGFQRKDATTYYVPQANAITSTGGLTRRDYDPQGGNTFYEIMSQCLSRNRDLNGNGVIDESELRWYLPAMGKYARMVIGRNALKAPIFDPDDVAYESGFDGTPDPTSKVGGLSCFHYASSDNLLLMSEYGMWIERYGFNGDNGKNGYALAWQVRCIRNLGANLSEVVPNDPVQRAYTIDTDSRMIEMTYYQDNAVRTAYYGAGHPMQAHTVFAPENLPYKKFQYAKTDLESTAGTTPLVSDYTVEIRTGGNVDFIRNTSNGWGESIQYNTLCSKYYENEDESDKGTWRVPNQTELTILRRETTDVFDISGLYNGAGTDVRGMWCWPSCTINYVGTTDIYMAVYFNNHRQNSNYDSAAQKAANRYWSNSAWLDIGLENTTLRLRCVRDIRE